MQHNANSNFCLEPNKPKELHLILQIDSSNIYGWKSPSDYNGLNTSMLWALVYTKDFSKL